MNWAQPAGGDANEILQQGISQQEFQKRTCWDGSVALKRCGLEIRFLGRPNDGHDVHQS
jgi:hypothetical protein